MTNELRYKKEFDFLIHTLEYSKIPYHTACSYESFTSDVDLSLRKSLGFTDQFAFIKNIFEKEIKKQSLVYVMDEFFCHYILLVLPDTASDEILIIGPYLTSNDNEKIMSYLEKTDIAPTWLSVLKNYYIKIPCLPNENALNAILSVFADCIWGKGNYIVEHFINGVSASTFVLTASTDTQHHLDALLNMDLIESFYSQENALMHAISVGQVARAKHLLSNLPLLTFKNQGEPLQNLKTFSIALNTLFRKAAEHSGVHPVYIDQLSTLFLEQIWTLTRSDNVLDLWNDMIQKYCAVVNNNSTRKYSLPVQRVIIKINLDLSADLSLKAMAEYLNVNASYLSNLFRKETGYTITNYVNIKRMEYAAFLLTSTTLPISTIAQHCGILDDNYFTKLFKKQHQLTPTQFRESVGRHDLSK